MAGSKVIGIFGGVGSGKSEASQYLKRKYKAYVIQADDIAHRLYKKGQPGYKAILRICGKSVIGNDKQIDRKKLSELLYNNPLMLSEVNHSIHPMVYKKITLLIDAYRKKHYNGLVVYEAALLPSDKVHFIDEYWYVFTPEEIRIERLKETRGYSDEKIKEIMSNQPTEDEYRSISDYIIVNDEDLQKMEEQIDEIIKHSERKQR